MAERSSSQEELRREDPSMHGAVRLDEALRNPDARFVLFRGEDALLEPALPVRPVLLRADELGSLQSDLREAVVLGVDEGGPRWALDIEGTGADETIADALRGEFRNLRSVQDPIDSRTWELLSRARVLLSWNRASRLCPTCGAATNIRNGGVHRVCSNTACGRTLYPRTEPTVIVRVVCGEKLLLARKSQFAPGSRSVIAGFVEPGETLEAAVRREVAEEVGVAVDRVNYLGSQPWPFPASLMIAFEARASAEAIRIDLEELEAAAWYTREEVRRDVAAGVLVLPSKKSIARRMIEDWLDSTDEADSLGPGLPRRRPR